MGLAPYGRAAPRKRFMVPRGPAEMQFFQAKRGKEWAEAKAAIEKWRSTSKQLNYKDSLPSSFAATIQHEAEEAMLEYARWLHHASGANNLCLSGGVALNCVANSYLAREAGFARVFVPPSPGDDGIAVGCALYGAAIRGELRRDKCPVFLGRQYADNVDVLKKLGLQIAATRTGPIEWIAERLTEGAVVAWYQGGAELGPRALGHRSFLADPRRSDMRDYLNKTVKNREPFRPFAPVVLEEAAQDYFEDHYPSYYMSFVARVRIGKRDVIPAVTHIDGTARYQVLREEDNAELHKLIVAFAKRTGVPMLLNTSFNRAGEPIVETPEEAARCMLAASADYLVLGNGSEPSRCSSQKTPGWTVWHRPGVSSLFGQSHGKRHPVAVRQHTEAF
jgi:carbamoyltransferase